MGGLNSDGFCFKLPLSGRLSILCPMSESGEKVKIIARNRKARHDYEIISSIEAGIELLGTEVKSLRDGKVTITDSYAYIEGGQIFLKNLHIPPFAQAAEENHEPDRTRRLLLHRREIRKLAGKTQQQGLTLIPLSIYVKGSLIKIELALAAGRKKYDKRQAIAKAEADRKMRIATHKSLKGDH